MRLVEIACASVLLGLYACAAPKDPEPKILGTLSVGGKGSPNGRSDSGEPYAEIIGISSDSEYGYSKGTPIRVGGVTLRERVRSTKQFLNALLGSLGEPVEYERSGSCCPFPISAISTEFGLLDVYKVRVIGSQRLITLYVDIYKAGTPLAPAGFKIRKSVERGSDD